MTRLILAFLLASTTAMAQTTGRGTMSNYCGEPQTHCETDYERQQRMEQEEYQKMLETIARCIRPEDCGGYICSAYGCLPEKK